MDTNLNSMSGLFDGYDDLAKFVDSLCGTGFLENEIGNNLGDWLVNIPDYKGG